MSVLRTLLYSAVGGTALHVSMRVARRDFHLHTSPRRSSLQIVPSKPRQPEYSPAVSSRDIQLVPKTAELDLVARIRQIERQGIAGAVTLLQCELDLRLSALEDNFARQTSDLNAIRDMTFQRDLRIGSVAREVELLCERVSSASLAPLTASPETGAAARFREHAQEPSEDERRSKMKAMFAFEESEPQAEKRTGHEQPEFALRCPTCRSSQTRQAHRLTFLDECLMVFALNPWRCRRCKSRFYHVRWGASIDLAAARRKWQGATARITGLARFRRPKPTETLAG